ncbi:peptidase [Rhodocytophaga rosea]|uniref:Peptidase n=1 Tax=Rhodocytophaga rosea TaxID=2704465 RepID=A0A6C0GN73_9BACT|nr:LON peptidase substrate-binding domain-containing protein [Rhodocytophaga rosea]QHT69387.1 peptidase [Rhodocytophaga rosea]
MKKTLPLFPLNLVVFPNEKLNLHIFEPRYRQLIGECLEQESNFGIPAFINNKIESYGTEMKIVALNQVYEDGRMDIETQGVHIFKLLNFDNPFEDKLYAGGEVEIVDLLDDTSEDIFKELVQSLKRLYELLQLNLDLNFRSYQFISFEMAHKVGLSVEQEYELLTIPSESDRQLYLLSHLKRAIPIIYDMERTKERVRMNGHFRHFDPLNF